MIRSGMVSARGSATRATPALGRSLSFQRWLVFVFFAHIRVTLAALAQAPYATRAAAIFTPAISPAIRRGYLDLNRRFGRRRRLRGSRTNAKLAARWPHWRQKLSYRE